MDTQLNSMRLISGALWTSTPLTWLLVLANIEPPAIRRQAAVDRLMTKLDSMSEEWPIDIDLYDLPQ